MPILLSDFRNPATYQAYQGPGNPDQGRGAWSWLAANQDAPAAVRAIARRFLTEQDATASRRKGATFYSYLPQADQYAQQIAQIINQVPAEQLAEIDRFSALPAEERTSLGFAQLLSGQTAEEMRTKQAKAEVLVTNLLAQGIPIQEAYQQALDTYGQEVARIAPEMESLGEGPQFEAAYQRSYQPFLQQLDKDMRDRHQDVLERHATRGIAGGTPESYDTALLERERTDTMKRGALEARSQALGEYRSGKAAALDVRGAGLQNLLQNWERTAVPALEFYGVPQSTRQQIVEGGATTNLGQRLANAAEMHRINTERKAAGQQGIMNLLGGGLGAAGQIGAAGFARGGAFGSAPELKTDIRPEPNDEQALDIFRDADVSKWRYNEEPPGTEHVGTMTTELPEEMLSPDGQGIDIPSYLGRLTQAVKALDKKIGGFERLLRGQPS